MRPNSDLTKRNKEVKIDVEKQIIVLIESLSLDLIYPVEVALNSKITSDLKFDSTDREELVMSLEDLFDVDIENTKQFEDISVKDIIIFVKKQIQKEVNYSKEDKK